MPAFQPNVLLPELTRRHSDSQFVLSPRDISLGTSIPDSWRGLLQEQESTNPLSWELLWDGFEDCWPNVFRYLRERCIGVVLRIPQLGLPSLIYVDPYRDDTRNVRLDGEGNPTGYSFWEGGHPFDSAVDQRHAAKRNLLPPKLEQFYVAVHNGWTEMRGNSGGPVALEFLELVSDEYDEDDLGDGIEQFSPKKTLIYLRSMSSDDLCVEIEPSGDDGTFRGIVLMDDFVDDPWIVDNFWEQLNDETALQFGFDQSK